MFLGQILTTSHSPHTSRPPGVARSYAEEMPRTRLYLDVDGVINAPLIAATWASSRRRSTMVNLGGGLMATCRLDLAPAQIRALDALIAAHDLELVWLTTWNEGDGIRKLERKLEGLAGGRRLGVPREETRGTWKKDALIADQERAPSPYIWIDDIEVGAWGAEVDAAVSAPHLHIATDPDRGLTRAQLDEVAEFVARVPA